MVAMPAHGPELRPSDLLPGTKYRIVKQLGVGGMGIVYQVVKPPEIHGVLKLMGEELTGHVEFRSRFLDEVRVLAQLDHPNIVKVFDYDTTADGTPFFVMEVLHGQTVRDVLSTMRTIPPRVAYEITRQLLEALHAAHTHDVMVVHRDVKPENIFLHSPKHGEPIVKLIDFGVVALSNRQHDGTFVGTWSYAAPEQIRGERATPATDLYAVGLVLYEMLAGVGPFEHCQTGQSLSIAHLNEVPDPVSKLAPWVPASIVALIASALSKDPTKRPRDAYAFAERLFELQWATDGKDPLDQTTAGPLTRLITHVSGASKAPISGFPMGRAREEARHRGATLKGIGDKDELRDDERTSASASPEESGEDGSEALSAGFARQDSSPAKRPVSDQGIVDSHVAPSASRPLVHRASTIETDTFASQESDSQPKAKTPIRSVAAMVALGAAAVVGLVGFLMLRGASSATPTLGAAKTAADLSSESSGATVHAPNGDVSPSTKNPPENTVEPAPSNGTAPPSTPTTKATNTPGAAPSASVSKVKPGVAPRPSKGTKGPTKSTKTPASPTTPASTEGSDFVRSM